MTNSRNTVVTLVHGTWASKSEWHKPKHRFQEHLFKTIPSLKEVHVLKWSGRNSHKARLLAAKELVNRHNELMEHEPSINHFIVAHSHGGNAAMYAVTNKDVEHTIAGVCCLSTPFIHFRSFKFMAGADNIAVWAWMGLIVISLLMAFVGAGFIDNYFLSVLESPVQSHLATAGVIVLSSIVLIGLPMALTTLRYISLEDAQPLPPSSGFNLFVIRASGDEANGVLGLTQTASWIARQIYGLLAIVVRAWRFMVKKLTGDEDGPEIIYSIFGVMFWLFSIFGFVSIAGLGYYYLEIPMPIVGYEYDSWSLFLLEPMYDLSVLDSMSVLAVSFWIVCATGIFLFISMACALLITLIMILILYILRIPFGFWAPWSTLGPLSMEVTAEPVPPGRWNILQLSPGDDDIQGLWHSASYTQPAALEAITDWINESLKKV